MEELRSTEILDKEIREDARRKANRILNNSVIDFEKILEDVNIRFEKDAEIKKAEYESKISNYKKLFKQLVILISIFLVLIIYTSIISLIISKTDISSKNVYSITYANSDKYFTTDYSQKIIFEKQEVELKLK